MRLLLQKRSGEFVVRVESDAVLKPFVAFGTIHVQRLVCVFRKEINIEDVS